MEKNLINLSGKEEKLSCKEKRFFFVFYLGNIFQQVIGISAFFEINYQICFAD